MINHSTLKANSAKVNKAVQSETKYYRPDLQGAAMARASTVKKATKAKKNKSSK